jgi:hypothetical protein
LYSNSLICGWHAEHQGNAFIGDRGDRCGGIEARHWLHGSAGRQRSDQDVRVADDVRYRQNTIGLVRRLALRARHPGAEQQVAVGQHYPFGIAGGARGIDEGGDLAGPIHLDRLWHCLPIQRPDAERSQPSKHGNFGVMPLCMLARGIGYLDRIKHAWGAAVFAHQIDLASRQPRVHHH